MKNVKETRIINRDSNGNLLYLNHGFIEEVFEDKRLIKQYEKIKCSEGYYPSYEIFIKDKEGEIRKELFIERLEYYESYLEVEVCIRNTKYTVVLYYGID